MSEKSGGSGPPKTFNLYNVLHRGQMPSVSESHNKSYKVLKHAYFTHPSDSEKYFVLSGEALRGMDIFDVQESLQLISQEDFKTYTRLNSGDILIQTANTLQIDALQKLTTFGHDKKPVEVSENGVLNQSHAIIRCNHIMNVEIDKITKKLASQGVISVQRLKRKVEDKWVDTSTHLLTFNTPVCPAEIRVGYLWCRTEIYIPSPFRCVVCQKLGHTRKRCDSKKNVPTCGFCAEPAHSDGKCPNQSFPRCVNCKDAHPSSSKSCPRYMEEKEINAIRVTMRIPYNLAREEFKKRKFLPTQYPRSMTTIPPSSSKTTLAQIIQSQEEKGATKKVSPRTISKQNLKTKIVKSSRNSHSTMTNKSYKRLMTSPKVNTKDILDDNFEMNTLTKQTISSTPKKIINEYSAINSHNTETNSNTLSHFDNSQANCEELKYYMGTNLPPHPPPSSFILPHSQDPPDPNASSLIPLEPKPPDKEAINSDTEMTEETTFASPY